MFSFLNVEVLVLIITYVYTGIVIIILILVMNKMNNIKIFSCVLAIILGEVLSWSPKCIQKEGESKCLMCKPQFYRDKFPQISSEGFLEEECLEKKKPDT